MRSRTGGFGAETRSYNSCGNKLSSRNATREKGLRECRYNAIASRDGDGFAIILGEREMNAGAGADVMRRTRFLLVDGDKGPLAAIEKFLLACGAPHVYTAPAPLAALRILQDPLAKVDCVICAHKHGTISGLQFLQGLRAGRWGPGRIQNVKFILMMGQFDVSAIQTADRSGVSGYYIGVPKPKALLAEIIKALTAEKAISPFPAFQVAHVNMGGADFVLVPFDESFAHADVGAQQVAVGQMQTLMQEQLLAGAVTPVWETADHGVGYFAPPQFHVALGGLTLDFLHSNLNREITVLQPPPFAVLSSAGSDAYAEYIASERKKTQGPDDVLYLAGFEAPRGVNGGPP